MLPVIEFRQLVSDAIEFAGFDLLHLRLLPEMQEILENQAV